MKTALYSNQLICSTCGTWVTPGSDPCPTCSDDRQYVPPEGQRWTKPEDLHTRYKVHHKGLQKSLTEFVIHPSFAIGQRALLVESVNGNILWDCIPLLDKETIAFIKAKGGLKAIAISHPHYYSNMNEWAGVFDCPVYIHKKDEAFISQKGEHQKLWTGEKQDLWDGMCIFNIGGHFPGSSVLHVPFLSKQGTLLIGDTLYLSPSMKHFAAMHSYPNRIPLPHAELKRVKEKMDMLSFDRVYGFYSYQNLLEHVQDIMQQSWKRYEV